MEASLVGRLLMLTPLPYSLLADTTLLGALNGQRTSFGIQPRTIPQVMSPGILSRIWAVPPTWQGQWQWRL